VDLLKSKKINFFKKIKNYSPELLRDFQVKKDPIPLRKLKTKNNVMSERFENILKRNVIGEYQNDHAKKKNRK
jgi:hypothetical protein